MADEKDTIIADDDAEDIEEDKTSIENEGDEDEEEDKSKDKTEDKSKDELKRSEIAQKIKYRAKYKEASSKVAALEAELAKHKDVDLNKKPSDDAEARAQAYIRNLAKEVVQDELKSLKSKEERITQEFEEKVEEVLEENPDITEKELLKVCEDYEVEPDKAAKILKRFTTKKEKPKMPQVKRASTDSELPKEKSEDKGKSMWEIAKDEIAKLKK